MEITEYYKEKNSPYYSVQFEFNEKFTPLDPNDFSPSLKNEISEIHQWCYKNFGPGLGNCRLENSTFIHRWINNIEFGEVKFSDKKDLDWFVLKWN